MHIQLGRRVSHDMPVVLGIMSAEEGPEAIPVITMDIAVLLQGSIVAQDNDAGFDISLTERRGLPHESLDQPLMALGQHGRHRIPFGGEVEQQEDIIALLDGSGALHGHVDVGDLIFLGVGRHGKVREGETAIIVEAFGVAGTDRVTVKHIVTDVHIVVGEKWILQADDVKMTWMNHNGGNYMVLPL